MALRSAVRTVEGTLAAERLRVAELKHRTINVRQPHHEHASHAQTLLQKLEEERRQRRELRTRLAAASLQLDSSAAQVAQLSEELGAVKTAYQQERAARAAQSHELKAVLLDRRAAVEEQLRRCREAAAQAEARADGAELAAGRLREQISATRKYAAAQTAALAAATAAKQRLQDAMEQSQRAQGTLACAAEAEVAALRGELESTKAAVAVHRERLTAVVCAAAQATGECELKNVERQVRRGRGGMSFCLLSRAKTRIICANQKVH